MNTPSESMKFRCKIIMTCIFLILFGIVIANFFKISVLDNAKYQKYANDSHFGPIKISAHRGSIYDANGTPLARSASVYKVFIDPKAFEDDLKSLQKDIDDENKQKQAGTFVKSTSKDYVPLPVSAEAYRQATVAFLADKLSVTTDDVEEDMKKDKVKFIHNSLREARTFSKEVRQYLYEIEKERPLTETEKSYGIKHTIFMFIQTILECLFRKNMMIFFN